MSTTHHSADDSLAREREHTLELREEQLVAHKELREVGEVSVRTDQDRQAASRWMRTARRSSSSMSQLVTERDESREVDGVWVMPVYEEQLVVTKRLILRERVRIRRVSAIERQLFEDTLRREHLVLADPSRPVSFASTTLRVI